MRSNRYRPLDVSVVTTEGTLHTSTLRELKTQRVNIKYYVEFLAVSRIVIRYFDLKFDIRNKQL